MFTSVGFLVAIVGAWLTIGLVLAVVMGRRGHGSFGWLVLGVLLGPLGAALAVDATRHDEQLEPVVLKGDMAATTGTGPVDVLVGYDGSPESAAATDAVVAFLGDRLGRLTVATVVPYGDTHDHELLAASKLNRLAGHVTGYVPALEILHGHPSAALTAYAAEGGYELIAVGTRGGGFSKAVMGSAASELARDSKVPILFVGQG